MFPLHLLKVCRRDRFYFSDNVPSEVPPETGCVLTLVGVSPPVRECKCEPVDLRRRESLLETHQRFYDVSNGR